MKWSTGILVALLWITVAGMLLSNIVIKKEFDKVDKADSYWTYGKVLDQPFKYLVIDGGNITNIAFEPSPNCSVRVLHDYQRNHDNPFSATVRHDSLYLKFTYQSTDPGEKNWMKWITLVRIFAPEIRSVQVINSNFAMFKLKQKKLKLDMSGRSKFEVESFIPDLDSLSIAQKDSSEAVFEMSPEYKPAPAAGNQAKPVVESIADKSLRKSAMGMTMQFLHASLHGYSILDVGGAQIRDLSLDMADSSAIVLSGGALSKYCPGSH